MLLGWTFLQKVPVGLGGEVNGIEKDGSSRDFTKECKSTL